MLESERYWRVNPVKSFLQGNLRQAGTRCENNDVKQTMCTLCSQPLRERGSICAASLPRIIFSAARERDGEQGKAKEKDARNHFNTPTWGAYVNSEVGC